MMPPHWPPPGFMDAPDGLPEGWVPASPYTVDHPATELIRKYVFDPARFRINHWAAFESVSPPSCGPTNAYRVCFPFDCGTGTDCSAIRAEHAAMKAGRAVAVRVLRAVQVLECTPLWHQGHIMDEANPLDQLAFDAEQMQKRVAEREGRGALCFVMSPTTSRNLLGTGKTDTHIGGVPVIPENTVVVSNEKTETGVGIRKYAWPKGTVAMLYRSTGKDAAQSSIRFGVIESGTVESKNAKDCRLIDDYAILPPCPTYACIYTLPDVGGEEAPPDGT